MSLKPIIAGNWKLHCNIDEAVALSSGIAKDLNDNLNDNTATVIIAPTFTSLHAVKTSGLNIAAQDCSTFENGAHTGEVSAAMLKDIGCKYIIVGHSERRTDHNESNEQVRQKAEAALNVGLTPIICIGESLQQREGGTTLDVLTKQVQESLPKTDKHIIVAYEPIWAIGTGKVASVNDITEVHDHLRGLVGETTHLLYGGSVKPDNAKDILAIDNVNGALVGGASLQVESFLGIVEAA